MKAPLGFDPNEHTYGEATGGVRRILLAWETVDWFVPAQNARSRALAMDLFEEHHAAAHRRAPAVFGRHVTLRTIYGGWRDMRQLYERVSPEACERAGRPTSGWDWKYRGLKPMTKAHSAALGLRIADLARSLDPDHPPRPGELFFRMGDTAIWCAPKLPDLRERLPAAEAELASWYLGYAAFDAMEAIEWQLAERSDDLAGNPFVPLLGVYAEGFYPFSVAANEVVLFAFGAN